MFDDELSHHNFRVERVLYGLCISFDDNVILPERWTCIILSCLLHILTTPKNPGMREPSRELAQLEKRHIDAGAVTEESLNYRWPRSAQDPAPLS